MADNDLVTGPNTNAAVSLDDLPMTALQAIYHAVTGKTENLAKLLNGSVLIDQADIDRLYTMLMQQIDVIDTVTAPTVTIVIKTADARTMRHSSWAHFKRFQTNEFIITSEVVLRIEMLMKLPNLVAPQRMVINISLDSSLPVIAPDERMTPDTGLLDFLIAFGGNWRTCRVSVDFVDFITAQRFISSAEEWFNQLRKMPQTKINSWLVRNWRLLKDTIDNTPTIGLAAFVAFYGARHPDYPDTLSAPLSSAALAIAIMAILSSTKGQMAVFFMRRLTHNILPTIILLTTGDERRFDDYQKARASASTTIAAWLMLPVISILLNIASNYIYDYFR
ncbi:MULTISPECIES: hypothetical protein [unclassified Sphingomonas]|uniref:hypothetical protein n=1 Tax=unclassified Sphingomonas TaxID=196159 RepID=UPI00131B7A80|nr:MULTISPECIES: hypothetical protein [unclassified Sphingomonas]MBP2512786.1 hypothetical protein [Sphingomonas sp. PvP018]